MSKRFFAIFSIIMIGAVIVVAQQPVDVRKISAAATGTQTGANSDSVVCATDLGCVSPNGDPCENPANTRTSFNVQSTATTAIVVIPATAAKIGYICSLTVNTLNASGDTFDLLDGTQTTNPCDSGTPVGVLGGTTAATGVFLSTSGTEKGNGAHWLFKTTAVNRQLCAQFVSTTRATLAGVYVVQ